MSKKGFTLVEILTVILIIILLTALLVPGLNKARQLALRAQCANNLKQVGIAMHAYAVDNNGDFPPDTPWSAPLYSGNYIDDEDVFDCPVHDYVGTAAGPDYWYTAGLTTSSPSYTRIVGCYDGAHSGLENHLCVDGRVITE